MKFFVTGAAGFIGFHVARRLLLDGHEVVGYDGITDYYDPSLKRARLALLDKLGAFTAIEAMLEHKGRLEDAIAGSAPHAILHLAAQAGVRYSLENPGSYISANLVGTFNLLEAARLYRPAHLLIASTSSVYGGNLKTPFAEADRTDFPISLYAATKKSVEAISHSYAHLFGIPTTVMRFFTVYGPWGRPDMALYRFVSAIEDGKPIVAYGDGTMKRDFTYVDDIVEAMIRLAAAIPESGKPLAMDGVADSLSPVAPWRVVNIGSGHPVPLSEFIAVIERALGKTALNVRMPVQAGDVQDTFADSSLLKALTGYAPTTPLQTGVENFVQWYTEYTGPSASPIAPSTP